MKWKNEDPAMIGQKRRIKRFAWIPVFEVQNPSKENGETYTVWLEEYYEIEMFLLAGYWTHFKNELSV